MEAVAEFYLRGDIAGMSQGCDSYVDNLELLCFVG